jgi:phosphatidylglycerophosphate synthase
MPNFDRIVVAIALIVVLTILVRGLKSFFVGGNIDEKRKSNKLMQLRVFAQFIAIIIIMALAYFYKK